MAAPFVVDTCALALFNMFRRSPHFDICVVRGISAALGLKPTGPGYDALCLMHCVRWDDMPEGYAARLQAETLAFFRSYEPTLQLPTTI